MRNAFRGLLIPDTHYTVHTHPHSSRKASIKSEWESPFTNIAWTHAQSQWHAHCSGCCTIVDLSCPASTLHFNVPYVMNTSTMKENVMVKICPTSMEHEAEAKWKWPNTQKSMFRYCEYTATYCCACFNATPESLLQYDVGLYMVRVTDRAREDKSARFFSVPQSLCVFDWWRFRVCFSWCSGFGSCRCAWTKKLHIGSIRALYSNYSFEFSFFGFNFFVDKSVLRSIFIYHKSFSFRIVLWFTYRLNNLLRKWEK